MSLRIVCAAGVVTMCLLTNLGTAETAAQRPNIIFVLTDDQRWDALGCMGNEIVRTPHIDRLAQQGTLFTNMFCTTSICATSRASFLIGQYERRHEIDDFRTPLTEEQFAVAFPSLLRQHGYRTALIGKWGLGGELPEDKYDHFAGFSGQGRYFSKDRIGQAGEHLTAKIAQQAVDFLDDCSAEQPFLLQVYTKAAHCQDGEAWQFQADPKYKNLFAHITIPSPSTATDSHFHRLQPFLQITEARRRWFWRFANPQMYQETVKDYYRLIAGIDDLVGSVVAKLHEKNLADNTVVIFSSDNGFYLGEHGLAGKWFMHEESIRLPLVIYDPRLSVERKGIQVAEMALNIDVSPTILELAGIEIPQQVQGKSLFPLMQGRAVNWRDEFFYEHRFGHSHIPQSEGVRTQRWKYARYTSVPKIYATNFAIEELYDLQGDPAEEHNLVAEPKYADQLAEMRAKWERWRERAR